MYTPESPAGRSTDTRHTIGIRELRGDLSGFVRRAGAGHGIVVTQHGVAVAALGPLGGPTADIESLIATGGLIAPRRRGTWRARAGVTIAAGTRIDQAMRDIRG